MLRYYLVYGSCVCVCNTVILLNLPFSYLVLWNYFFQVFLGVFGYMRCVCVCVCVLLSRILLHSFAGEMRFPRFVQIPNSHAKICIVGLTHFWRSFYRVLFSSSFDKLATDVAKCICWIRTTSWWHAWWMQIVMTDDDQLVYTVMARSKLICWAYVPYIYAALYVTRML